MQAVGYLPLSLSTDDTWHIITKLIPNNMHLLLMIFMPWPETATCISDVNLFPVQSEGSQIFSHLRGRHRILCVWAGVSPIVCHLDVWKGHHFIHYS